MPYTINIDQISRQLRIRPEVYKRIVTKFAETLTEKMEILDEALTEDNKDQMRKTLHEIRGTAGNLRLREIGEPMKDLHAAIHGGEPQEKLIQHMGMLKSELKELEQSIKDMPKKFPS